MENLSWRKILVCLMIIIMSGECREPVLHRVGGGKYTWREGINFTEWASHEHFNVGDWLYFGFNKSRYNVVEVNKTSYERCKGEDFIRNITRGGRDVFNLTEAKPYYFISSLNGYCLKGVKVEINVECDPPPHSNSYSPLYPPTPTTAILLSAALLFTFLF